MKPLVIIPLILISGCASVSLKTMSEENHDIVFSSTNANEDFEEFLKLIRVDEEKIADNGTQFDIAESAFRFGILAIAAYGGFTTTYEDAKNLKDAAFAAASLTSLRSVVVPEKRRDASRQASQRLECLLREVEPFRGDFYQGVRLVSTSLQDVQIQRRSGVGTVPQRTLPRDWLRRSTSFRNSRLSASQRRAVERFEKNIEETTVGEKQIYDRRFSLVLGVYRQIIKNWQAAADAEFQSYESLIEQFKISIESEVEQEIQQNENAEEARGIRRFVDNDQLDQVLEIGTKYSDARTSLLECATQD